MNTPMINAELYRRMLCAAVAALQAKKEDINHLNVFPVPDGDTGSNMFMTLDAARSVAAQTDNLSAYAEASAKAIMRAARGNSGVILSLFFRGVAQAFAGHETADGALLIKAFETGSESARKAVMKPVEGTILTVMRECTKFEASDASSSINSTLENISQKALEILKKTPEMLPALKRAKVVDSGGYGFTIVLSGMIRALNEEALKDIPETIETVSDADFSAFSEEEIVFSFCTECLINRAETVTEDEIDELRVFLAGLGDSVVLVADDEIVKVHVHTNEPMSVLNRMLTFGVPPEYSDRETLWNAVEKAEHGKNAQLAYSFDIALQNELSLDENIALTRQLLSEQFVSRGMIVDFAVHQPEKDGIANPHFHVMCPIRPLKDDGTWDAKQHREYLFDEAGNPILDDAGHQKFDAVPTTDWGTPETLDAWRKAWADLCNAKFTEKNLDCRIDNRSYEKQGVDLLPTIHEGPAVREMEKRGIRTDKGDHNRLIRQINAALKDLKSKLKALVTWIADLKEELSKPPEPTVYDLLNIALQRRNEGAWSFVAKSRNLQNTSKLVAYLQQHGITTVSDLEAHIQDVSAQSEPVKTKLHDLRDSIKQIDDLLKAGERYEKLKPIFDEYSKKFFKKSKDSFYAEHEKELKAFYAVRRKLKDYLDDNGIFHAGKLEKRRDALEKEFDRINEENAPLKEQIATLNAIRKAITQAQADSSENRGHDPISEQQNVQKEPQHEQPQPKKKHELEI